MAGVLEMFVVIINIIKHCSENEWAAALQTWLVLAFMTKKLTEDNAHTGRNWYSAALAVLTLHR